jgi:hypothetical protein
MDDATRALADRSPAGKAAEVQDPAASPGTLAASERPPAAQVRGN